MKTLKLARSMIGGFALGLAVLSGGTVAQAHPYASCLTNFTSGGTNFVSFYLNEGGGAVTVTTYPSGAINSLGTLAAGGSTFAIPSGDSSYAITVSKTGTGVPSQLSPDTGFDIWNGGMTLRAVAVNSCAQYGDAFGRVFLAATGQATADSGSGGPAYRGWGVYALTPDMANNALYGGKSPIPAVPVIQSNTLAFSAVPANAATFVMDGITLTWTTNAVTNTATQVPVGSSIAASATNLATALNLNLASYIGTVSVSVTSNVVSLLQYAQATSGASYFTYANPANLGPFGNDFTTGDSGFGSGPYRMNVDPADGTLWVTDATDGNANCYIFGRNIESTNQLFTVTGRLAGEAVLEHGNVNDIAMRGSIAKGTLQVWTADNDMPVPQYFNNTNNGTLGLGGVGNFGAAQETVLGDANEIYRYDILTGNGTSASGFPVTNTPVYACTLGLDGGFPDGQVCSVAVGPNTNYVYAAFRRANNSDGNVQVFRSDTGARVYTSLTGSASSFGDIFAYDSSASDQGCYGLKVSPDGRFLAGLLADSEAVVVNLTNGIPDPSSVFYVTNATLTTTSRELSWDAADNLYINNGTTYARLFSLGLTTTCVTSNDMTGTNGSFQLIVPPADVTVANAGNASQNYGSPVAGYINVNLGTSSNATSVPVAFKIGGTGVNAVNYNISNFTDPNGVVVVTNAGNIGTVTFPAGVFPGGGNWNVNIPITPTATPLTGPTYTVILTLQAGSTYIKGSPSAATVTIANTGPQYFFVSASPTATTMSRAITNDYAEFVLNRWGDLNGPGNSLGSVNPTTITLNTFTLGGTAVYPTDYTAGVQLYTGSVPVDGSASVSFAPGVSSATVLVGNPVSHANVLAAPVNKTIIPSLLTSGSTNGTSLEGYPYTVSTATVTLTEYDNAQGLLAEMVVWSDPLTNSAANTYSVTFASTNLASTNVLPVYIPNYTYTNGGSPNGTAASFSANSNSFDVMLGFPIANENAFETAAGVGFFGPAYSPPPSATMVANGWSNVMRLSVNKEAGAQPTMCGLNVFPTTNTFVGNYALRFDMYLSIWSGALNNSGPGAYPRQFAAFGINTRGTNCDWRLSTAGGIAANTGSGPTNADGLWFCVDAADLSLTPADFDAFASPGLPNAGTSDFLSYTALSYAGTFKRPPFPTTDGAGAGTPINQWVNVSVETTAQTNVAMKIDNATIFANLAITNNATTSPSLGYPLGLYTNGTPMLGYLQPYSYQSDESAFVYYSNIRMVELSPYVVLHPTNVANVAANTLVMAGTNLTLSSSATYASAPITNTWMRGTTTPATVVATHTSATTNFNDSLTLNNVTVGSNYWSFWSDPAGSVTSYVAAVEVISQPANVAVASGGKATFTLTASGNAAPTSYQWSTNGVALVNGTKYTNVATASMSVSNCQPSDALVGYACTVVNNATNLLGLFLNTNTQTLTTPAATLTIASAPTSVVVSPAAQTNLWGSSATFTVTASGTAPFTYGWKKGTTLLAGATKYSGTNAATLVISNLTSADAGSYTVAITNVGGTNLSSPGVLTVSVPAPTFAGSVLVNSGHLVLAFSSTNTYDKSNSFTLQSTTNLNSPNTVWTNNTLGTFSGSNGTFQVTVPQGTNSIFYRLLHD